MLWVVIIWVLSICLLYYFVYTLLFCLFKWCVVQCIYCLFKYLVKRTVIRYQYVKTCTEKIQLKVIQLCVKAPQHSLFWYFNIHVFHTNVKVSDLDNQNGVPSNEIGHIVRRCHQMAVVECQDAHDNTPLSEAASGGSVEAINFLIERGGIFMWLTVFVSFAAQ